MIQKIKQWAKSLKENIMAVYLVGKHKDTPAGAKILAVAVAAYALSPIDLIPDFIPVLGFLDDVILLPLGIMLVIRLVPNEVFEQCRLDAKDMDRPKNYVVAAVIAAVWIALIVYLVWELVK